MSVSEAMFTCQDRAYLPGDRARGPWSVESLHGGPVAGLLTHAIESQRDDDRFLVSRIAFDLMRPVPVSPLRLSTRLARAGRRVRYVDASISAGDETVARASAVMMRRNTQDRDTVTTLRPERHPHWSELAPRAWMDLPSKNQHFTNGVEVRLVGQPYTGQLMATWIKIPYELLPDRPLTPLERVGTISDFTNGMGIMSRDGPMRPLINCEITLHLFRNPLSEWLCLQCVARGESEGLATSNVDLYDENGLFGHTAVSAMYNPLQQ